MVRFHTFRATQYLLVQPSKLQDPIASVVLSNIFDTRRYCAVTVCFQQQALKALLSPIILRMVVWATDE